MDFTTYNNNHNTHDGVGASRNNLNNTTPVFTKSITVPLQQQQEQQQQEEDRNTDVTTPDFEECFGVAANVETTTTVATSNVDDKDDYDDDDNTQDGVKKQTLIQHPIFMTNKNSDSDLVSVYKYVYCVIFYNVCVYTIVTGFGFNI